MAKKKKNEKKLTVEETVQELELLRDYFKSETGGTCPMCIREAIEILNALSKIKEVLK